MTQAVSPTQIAHQRHLGDWVNLWHVGAALAAMVAAFWARQMTAVPALRSLVANPGYFDAGQPLLLDWRRAGYSADVAREHLTALGSAANSYYSDTYIAIYDLAFPLLLLAFGLLAILYATRGPHAIEVTPLVQRLMLAVPVALFLFDIAENIFIFTMLDGFPTVNAKVVETASMFTQLKWLAAFIEGLLLTGLGVVTVFRHIEAAQEAAK